MQNIIHVIRTINFCFWPKQFYSGLIKHSVGGGTKSHFILVAFQCFLYVATGNILYKILREHEHTSKYARLGWINFCVLLAFSGWITIPYTDGMAVIFPILILRTYQKKESALRDKSKNFYWILISLLSYWGYRMKPTVSVIFIAILIEEILAGIKNFSRNNLIKAARVGSIIILCFAISNGVFQDAFASTGIKINKEYDVGPIHFLMMGLKNDRDGVWDADDVKLSWSIPDKKTRIETQLKVIKQRLKDYGVKGFLRHLARKSLVIFNDGTFAWSCEGRFYAQIYEVSNTLISPKLRDAFYINGRTYPRLATIEQAIWLMTLFACLFCFMIKRNKINSVMAITLFGIILFEYLFEARARYLIIYVPVFIVMSMTCLEALAEKLY